MLTARSDREAHERALAAGADEVMTKPVAADVLLARLCTLLAMEKAPSPGLSP